MSNPATRHPRCDKMKFAIGARLVRKLLSYDPASGIFAWRETELRPPNWNATYAGKRAGYLHAKTRRRCIAIMSGDKKRRYQENVLAWLYMTGDWPTAEVDHENGDSSDNSWKNLRLATNSQNKCNRPVLPRNKLGIKGVWYDEGRDKYVMSAKFGTKRISRRYDTVEAAAAAYAEAAARMHGEFARTA
jgi:HNH endonuclease